MTGAGTVLHLADDAATRRLGGLLAASQPRPAVVFLQGDLGSGKSTLARAWLRALGVSGTVRSPTYTLVERYALADGAEALHLDLYRIGSGGELEFLGLDEVPAALWLVEWPERGEDGLPAPDLVIALGMDGSGRRARLRAGSAAGQAWLEALQAGNQLRSFPEP